MSSPDDLTGPKQQFFEKRKKVFPKAIDGPFRRFKWLVMAVTLTIYYVTPWLRWDRGPYAPDQAVLIDIANRRFYMFSIEIWPHEFYYVAGLLIMAGIGLFLVTSAVGRAWCGYACPQTVWTDLFQHVERAIEGDRNAQLRLEKAPWGPAKIGKRVTKHAIWLLIAVATGGAWIFYFADAPTLAQQLWTLEAPYQAWFTIGLLTATTYVLGGLMREQFCIYGCPWPRIQGAMLDEKSLAVTYKAWRGEPRTHGIKRAGPAVHQPDGELGAQAQYGLPSLVALASNPDNNPRVIGDCIDCNACVAVCPTGIDIRNGPQIGCITCGLCIDACDDIMEKIGRPKKLIGYSTVADELIAGNGGEPEPPLKRLLRPRTLAYFTLWGAIGLALLFTLGSRTRLDLSIRQERNPIWVQLSDGMVRNAYTINIRNMETRPRTIRLTTEGLADARIWTDAQSRAAAAQSLTIAIGPDQARKTRVYVAAPARPRHEFAFAIRANEPAGASDRETTVFEGPEGDR
ncbi:4Fe-4S dicluster domain-containing protein (plasmid) [Sphingobium naphthae]|uniref:4Fe-4S dicluster domain-containing protein n=1 Tax=Sphingobium naphthae TaxID=1886786 RepID=UPI000C90EDC5|nr:cytochrome c oxidase accessory protein CcoG [Erythrobacter sp.]